LALAQVLVCRVDRETAAEGTAGVNVARVWGDAGLSGAALTENRPPAAL